MTLAQVKPLLVLVQRYFVPETLVLAPAFAQVAPDFVAADATGGIASDARISAAAVRTLFLMTDTISNREIYPSGSYDEPD
jgi:hypothetical protein